MAVVSGKVLKTIGPKFNEYAGREEVRVQLADDTAGVLDLNVGVNAQGEFPHRGERMVAQLSDLRAQRTQDGRAFLILTVDSWQVEAGSYVFTPAEP